MNWNVLDLKEKAKIIESKISVAKNNEELKYLKNELLIINQMLSLIGMDKNSSPIQPIYSNVNEKKYIFFKNILGKLLQN